MVDMKLVAYCRTSTQNGAGANSLDAQEQACRDWAGANGHDVVIVFRDDALSGALGIEDRPGLASSLVALDDGSAEGLVVRRPDRLARELHVQEVALAHAWAAGEHVRVFEAAEGAEIVRDDPNDPQRRFLRQVMGAAAELERGLIKARLQGGRRRKAAQGGYIGGKRLHRKYGYELIDGEYRPIEHEHFAIEKILGYRGASPGPLSYQFIASELNRLEIPPPSGAEWYPMTCKRIWDREHQRRHETHRER
jgi:DNA invertase Pin-like site-specific DNA recombinase